MVQINLYDLFFIHNFVLLLLKYFTAFFVTFKPVLSRMILAHFDML